MLSVTIIAKNAQGSLEKCLQSVLPLSDDIVVVVDASSTDSTEHIARKFTPRVFIREFDNFSSQKNFALSRCKHPWVLSLDADEVISQSLADEITKLYLQPKTYNLQPLAYRIPRLNYIFGRLIYHSDWSPNDDAHVWLFNKVKSKWVGKVHEHVNVDGTIGNLSQPKIHYNYSSVEQFLEKMNLYTNFESEKRSFSPLYLLAYPIWKFIRHYFVYRGFLDGWHGLFLSYLMGIYGLSTLVKAWEKKNLSSH